MKVAIPVFGHRVSPVFDWCQQVIAVEIDSNGTEINREEIDLSKVVPFRRSERLASLKVNVLLCGGISDELTCLAEEHGMRVVPWVAGEVNTVLEAFVAGDIADPRFAMPGCNGRRQRRRRRRGWGGRR